MVGRNCCLFMNMVSGPRALIEGAMRFGRRLAAMLACCALLPLPAVAGPTLLFEAATGRILYAEDQDDRWHPASLTKIMTAYLVFEALKAGKITLETKLAYSEAAHVQPPSKIGLPVGAEMEVGTALRALIIKSANDVAVVLAEGIGGSEAAFVAHMNATAQRLGMTRTHFVNPNGLPAAEQVTTARDLARLSRAVVRDFPEYAAYWAEPEMRLGRVRLVTHNGLLKTYDGTDGIKTGFICDSGYNIVASATRDGVRLVAVVLGEASGMDRTLRTQALLDHGFTTYGWKQVFNPPSIENLPYSQETKEAISLRQSIMATECGNRRRSARVAQARAKAKAQRVAAAAAKKDGAAKEAKGGKAAPAKDGKAIAAPAPGKTPAKATKPAVKGDGGGVAAKPAPVMESRPKAAAAAPAAGGAAAAKP